MARRKGVGQRWGRVIARLNLTRSVVWTQAEGLRSSSDPRELRAATRQERRWNLDLQRSERCECQVTVWSLPREEPKTHSYRTSCGAGDSGTGEESTSPNECGTRPSSPWQPERTSYDCVRGRAVEPRALDADGQSQNDPSTFRRTRSTRRRFSSMATTVRFQRRGQRRLRRPRRSRNSSPARPA